MAAIGRMAWRNLGRNRRRTFITGLALAIGVALSVGAYGWVDGLVGELLHALTRYDLGHVQVHHPEYPRTRSSEHAISDPGQVLAAASNVANVRGAAPRVYAFALVSNAGKSLGVEIVGVDPEREPRVTVMHERVVAGRYLEAEPTPWPRGRTLTREELDQDRELTEAAEDEVLQELEGLEALEGDDSGDANGGSTSPDGAAPGSVAANHGTDGDAAAAAEPGGAGNAGDDRKLLTRELALTQSPPPERPPRVLIGAALARILRLDVGDRVHATGQTIDGLVEEVFFEVAGIYRTGTAQFDRSRMYIHYADLQRFLHLYDRVHEIALVAGSADDSDAVAASLRAALGDRELLIRSWKEIRPDIHRMLEVSQASSIIMVLIIFFVATLGVVNTMLMAVFERTRELGMLKAIGMSSWHIVGLIVTETLFLVLVSAAAGTALGAALVYYMTTHGIDLTSYTGGFTIGGIGLSPVIHGAMTARGLIMPTVVLSFMSFVASLYPAIRAARLEPAIGMRET